MTCLARHFGFCGRGKPLPYELIFVLISYSTSQSAALAAALQPTAIQVYLPRIASVMPAPSTTTTPAKPKAR